MMGAEHEEKFRALSVSEMGGRGGADFAVSKMSPRLLIPLTTAEPMFLMSLKAPLMPPLPPPKPPPLSTAHRRNPQHLWSDLDPHGLATSYQHSSSPPALLESAAHRSF